MEIKYLKTSIIIPTKNDEAHIEKCLASLMPYYEAGYVDEIIIIDGQSTDGTLDIVNRYPVKLIIEKGKGTVNIAFDFGWRHAKNELIMFMNSDVYIGNNFFPNIYEYVSNEKVRWISCAEKAVISVGTSETQAQSWMSSDYFLSTTNWLRRFYSRMVTMGKKDPLRGGPCMITYRSCLEEVNGLLGLTLGTLEVCGDICFSQRIEKKGWKTIWWVDAPTYHHPRTDFKGINKQFYIYGKSIAFMHQEKEFKHDYPWYFKILGLLTRIASPLVGIYMAIRHRNPHQLVVYPVPRFYWAWGYIHGWIAAKKLSQPVYSEPGIYPLK